MKDRSIEPIVFTPAYGSTDLPKTEDIAYTPIRKLLQAHAQSKIPDQKEIDAVISTYWDKHAEKTNQFLEDHPDRKRFHFEQTDNDEPLMMGEPLYHLQAKQLGEFLKIWYKTASSPDTRDNLVGMIQNTGTRYENIPDMFIERVINKID